MKVYALSVHADYRCRHSGACCSADWDVPVELPVYRSLTEALERGHLRCASRVDDDPLVVDPDLPAGAAAMLARTDTGHCVFFDRPSGLCVVHRDLGESALPNTCRHFPRVALQDARGIFVTLSNFCPTAAGLLFRKDVPLEILESPAGFPAVNYDGLTVSAEAWPPLLHPRMLMDLDGYSAWERHMVSRCALPHAPESVIATLFRDAALLREWTPNSGALADAVAALPRASEDAGVPDLKRYLRLYRELLRAVPEDLRPAPDYAELEEAWRSRVLPTWPEFSAPVNRFLATKAFASWTAYQGRGVLAIVQGIESALAAVCVEASRLCRNVGRDLDADLLREAFRAADFLIHHLAVAEELAREWSKVEDAAVPRSALQVGRARRRPQ